MPKIKSKQGPACHIYVNSRRGSLVNTHSPVPSQHRIFTRVPPVAEHKQCTPARICSEPPGNCKITGAVRGLPGSVAAGSSTASNHRAGSAGGAEVFAGPPALLCFLRRRAHAAKVGYLIPASAANLAPLSPLRSNSSSKLSHRSAGVLTRPRPSVFKTISPPFRVVIAEVYDKHAAPIQWRHGGRLRYNIHSGADQFFPGTGVRALPLTERNRRFSHSRDGSS